MTAKAKLTLTALISSLIYFALVISGAGGLRAFISRPAYVVMGIVLLVATVMSPFTQGNISPGEREDRSNRWVLAVFGVVGLAIGYFPAFTDRKEFWTIDGDTIRWIGVALFIIGAVLRMWPVFVLGRRFSGLVAIQPGHTLVTTGIYHRVRNPSYLGLLVNSVGWSLGFRSGVGLLLTALLIPPLIARINSEERLLHSQFGAEYEAYRSRTSRLIPGLY